MHLNDYAAFEKVLPSKVFELGAFPRPLIAGVNGYARQFIQKNLTDYILFSPGNVQEFCEKLFSYNYTITHRVAFIKEFKRSAVNSKMAASMKSYLSNPAK